ncbi:MAG: helix-turn-helix domain-containing protein [candidate division KSB1 bacterium]|nr:helix-turn-helix domain-containing protein [candidate division KSB1 bacterium]
MGQIVLEVLPLQTLDLRQNAAEVSQRRAYRRQMLAQMVAYAEGNMCRRRFILDYFGDAGKAEAKWCCDNCLAKASIQRMNNKATTETEEIALIILGCIKSLKWEVGREKLIQILKGSRAKDMAQFDYYKNPYYGKLIQFTGKELEGLVCQLLERKLLKVIGGEYPVLHLTPAGMAALQSRAAIPLDVPKIRKRRSLENLQGVNQYGTVEYTYQLFLQGLKPEAIAEKRGLTLGTIYNHLSQLIEQGLVSVEELVSPEVQQQIRQAILQVGGEALSSIKERLPESISYGEIRCVVANEKWQKNGLVSFQKASDAVAEFLAKPTPRPLNGPWQAGFALDFNSRFIGKQWQRKSRLRKKLMKIPSKNDWSGWRRDKRVLIKDWMTSINE